MDDADYTAISVKGCLGRYGLVQFAMLLMYSCDCLTTCANAFAIRAGSAFVDE